MPSPGRRPTMGGDDGENLSTLDRRRRRGTAVPLALPGRGPRSVGPDMQSHTVLVDITQNGRRIRRWSPSASGLLLSSIASQASRSSRRPPSCAEGMRPRVVFNAAGVSGEARGGSRPVDVKDPTWCAPRPSPSKSPRARRCGTRGRSHSDRIAVLLSRGRAPPKSTIQFPGGTGAEWGAPRRRRRDTCSSTRTDRRSRWSRSGARWQIWTRLEARRSRPTRSVKARAVLGFTATYRPPDGSTRTAMLAPPWGSSSR